MSFLVRRLVQILVITSTNASLFGTGPLAGDSFSSTSGPLNGTGGGSGWAAGWQTQNNSNNVPGYNIGTASPFSVAGVSEGGYATGGDNWQSTGRALDITSSGPF